MTRLRRGRGGPFLCILVACVAGCGSSTPGLEVTLSLTDQVLVAADSVRIVVSAADGSSFPAASRTTVQPGLFVSNVDVDGDGVIDALIELGREFKLGRDNRLSLEPAGLSSMRNVFLRAEVFDGLQNRLARLRNSDGSDRVPALVRPGETTRQTLTPSCVNEKCTDATERLAGAQQTLPSEFAVTALATGDLTGAPRRADVVAGASQATRDVPDPSNNAQKVTLPATGRVSVYYGGGSGATPLHLQAVILGAQAGDQLGASLATADLDGDGADELLVGAPGAGGGKGAVYVLFGGAKWPVGKCADASLAADCLVLPAAFSTQALPSGMALLRGSNVGDHLGLALAVGDGKQIAAGGLDRVRVFAAPQPAALADAGTDLAGHAGSQYGAALASTGGGLFAVGAPNDAPKGAVYVQAQPSDPGTPIPGMGGAFGASLSVADLDGDGHKWLIVGAPLDGAGSVTAYQLGGQAMRALRASSSVTQLGSSIARLSRPSGDALVVGAPSRLGGPQPGASYVVRGATLQVAPSLSLEADGKPAAAALTLGTAANATDGFGGHVATGDFNADGAVDLVYSGDKLPIAGAPDLQPGIAVFTGPLL